MGAVSSTIKLIDNMSSVLTKIGRNVDELANKLGAVGDQQSTFDNFSFDTFIQNAEKAGKKMSEIGKQMSLSLTLPIVTAGKKSYNAYKDHESAMTGVRKTVEATEEEFGQLEDNLINISETTPTGFVEAAKIMEMAGQLGISTDKLTDFTKAYIDLQESTNIGGEQGAADLARFMNVTGEDITNTARLGGVIVDLGNNFATTEQEILNMATRMGATADLAGFSASEILAFSTALSSVGINAEAGGSAAGKLMKKMQLAAEVGSGISDMLNNQDILLESKLVKGQLVEAYLPKFENGLDFQNWMYTASKGYKSTVADTLGITADMLQEYADNWLLMDQFSEIMGITGEDFLKGWKESPAQSMLAFFQGLGNLDPETGNSVLAQLAEMDITEIRLSNLVAAMAGNPELFNKALQTAYKQYNTDVLNNALAQEASKRYATTESQDQMLMNQLENSMSDLGQNINRALEPAKRTVNDLLKAFNGLSEVDQDRIVKLMGALALGGPALMMLGGTVTMVSNLAKALKTIAGLGGLGGALSGGTKAATAATATKGGGWLGKMFASGTAKAVGGGFAFISTLFENAFKPQGNDDLEAWFGSQEDYDQAAQRVLEENRNRTASNPSESPMVQAMQSIYGLYSQYGEGWVQAPGFENVMNQANQAFALNIGLLDSYIDKMEQTGNIDWLTTSASDAASATVESTSSVMNEGTGSEIGANFDAGIAGAISSGASSVISAAVSMVQQAIAAANAAAGIHSPSRETYWSGEMLIKGYVNAIRKGGSEVRSTMVAVMDNANRAVQSGAWKGIDYFAGLEQSQLQNPDSDIKVSDADIKKIRTLAEREAINKFTTAQIKVAFGGITNNVNKNMDLDEMMTYIEDRVSERLEAAAEGEYS